MFDNLTGLEGQTVCTVSLPPTIVNATLLSDLALCCIDPDPATIRVQDNCVHYCASNRTDFNKCIHNFLTPGFLEFCQNVSEKVETGEWMTRRAMTSSEVVDMCVVGQGEMRRTSMGWASLAVAVLSVLVVFT